jgi:hypothetical protein
MVGKANIADGEACIAGCNLVEIVGSVGQGFD